MLTFSQLRELAIKKQTTELNVRREYVQHLFLSSFYQQPAAGIIFFKGGTALRLIYGSPRFSEDLDFSTPNTNIPDIEDTIQNTMTQISREGLNTELIESKKTTGGYLAIIRFQIAEEKVILQIEMSFRDKSTQGEVITIANDFIPPYTIMGLKKEQIVKQKIQALIMRQKPRDYYDLYFILRANLLPPQEKKVLPQILKLVAKTHLSFDKELKQFLPKSHVILVKDFKSTLEKEIRRYT